MNTDDRRSNDASGAGQSDRHAQPAESAHHLDDPWTAAPGPDTGPAPATDDAEAPAAPPQNGKSELKKIRHTRTARAWTGLIVGALVLIVLLTFIIQNPESTEFQIFAWQFNLPLGVAILLTAIVGSLITALVGGARMIQLRRAAKRV